MEKKLPQYFKGQQHLQHLLSSRNDSTMMYPSFAITTLARHAQQPKYLLKKV